MARLETELQATRREWAELVEEAGHAAATAASAPAVAGSGSVERAAPILIPSTPHQR